MSNSISANRCKSSYVSLLTSELAVFSQKSLFQQERAKVKTALVHSVPVDIKCCNYDIPDLTNYFKENLFQQLQVS